MIAGRAGDLARAVVVLQRRGMVDVRRPWQAVAAARAMRRYGAFGGLASHAADRYGDSAAITDDDGTLTFRELEERSNALANGLAGRVSPGEVIGLLGRGHRHLLCGLIAGNKIGVRVVLLNTGFGPEQLADVCAREQICAVLAAPGFADALADLPKHITRLTDDVVDRLIASSPTDVPEPPTRPGGLVLMTSGTTGTPKGTPRERVSPLASAQLLDRIPWSAGGAYCIAAPLFHATGLATCTVGLALGNRVVLSGRFDAERTVAALSRHRAEVMVLVPTMLSRILDLGPDVLAGYDTSSLRVLFAAGSSLSPDLCRRTAAAFGDVLYNLYGSTEVATAAVATPAELRRAPGTVGRPPVGCTIAAYDAADRRITEPGEVGTIYVSSGLSFAGYTDGGKKKLIDGLLSSGDTGHFDADGLWFIDGRDDDMIVSGGENVFPLEVENVLAECPGISEAAVIGVPDDDFGQRLHAFVVADPGLRLDVDEIKATVRARLARHKVPRDVTFLTALPRNETGKVLKTSLAHLGPDLDAARGDA